jgi:hypothetical protein
VDIFANGLTAGAIALFCMMGVVNSIRTIRCTPSPHWTHYWRILSGVSVTVAFAYAFFDGLNGGPGTVPALLGRPAILFLSVTFFISSTVDYYRGRCK